MNNVSRAGNDFQARLRALLGRETEFKMALAKVPNAAGAARPRSRASAAWSCSGARAREVAAATRSAHGNDHTETDDSSARFCPLELVPP